MRNKKVIGNIKRWVEKCVYDASEILFEIRRYPNTPSVMFELSVIKTFTEL